MKTAEKNLWRYVRKGMAEHWDATRHEDRVTPGVPDVSFRVGGRNGWLELKTAERRGVRIRQRPAGCLAVEYQPVVGIHAAVHQHGLRLPLAAAHAAEPDRSCNAKVACAIK